MYLSLFVTCLSSFAVFLVIFPTDAATNVMEVDVSKTSFAMDSNMRRVTSVLAPMDGKVLDDNLDDIQYIDQPDAIRRGKKNTKMWDHWGKWSPCSVTCGVGKKVRWRHCVSDGCAPGEKEAQIKTCTLSPCQ